MDFCQKNILPAYVYETIKISTQIWTVYRLPSSLPGISAEIASQAWLVLFVSFQLCCSELSMSNTLPAKEYIWNLYFSLVLLLECCLWVKTLTRAEVQKFAWRSWSGKPSFIRFSLRISTSGRSHLECYISLDSVLCFRRGPCVDSERWKVSGSADVFFLHTYLHISATGYNRPRPHIRKTA